VVFAWLVGSILVSYEALAEAAKYSVPSVASWIAVEPAAGCVQFTLYGALLAACIARAGRRRPAGRALRRRAGRVKSRRLD